MVFKVLTFLIIFFLVKNLFKSWKLFQELQDQARKQNGPAGKKAKDDAIDAEFTVVDKE